MTLFNINLKVLWEQKDKIFLINIKNNMNAVKYDNGKNITSRREKTKATSSTDRRLYEVDEAGKRQFRGSKRPTEICSVESSTNAFLKAVFLPKLKENDGVSTLKKSKKLKMERGFYKSLSQLSEHYGLSQSDYNRYEFPYNICLSLHHCQTQMKKRIRNWQGIKLEQKGTKVYFVSEERISTGMTLFYIPVIPLYKMLHQKVYKRSAQLLLSVCTYLYHIIDIPYYRQENSYLFWLYEMLEDWIDQDEELEENSDYKRELHQAEKIGDIMERKISSINNLSFFQKRIQTFKPKNDFDTECLNLANKTFSLYSKFPEERIYRNVHFNNNIDFYNEDDDYEYDERVISMDKYISFFADDKGWAYRNIIDSVNNEFNEYTDIQEPIIYKVFNGKQVSNNTLDFELEVFEILNSLAGILGDFSDLNN